MLGGGGLSDGGTHAQGNVCRWVKPPQHDVLRDD